MTGRKVVEKMFINVKYSEPYDMEEMNHHITRKDLIEYFPDWEIDCLSPLNWSVFAEKFIRSYDHGAEYIKDWTITNYSMMEIK